jgi:hypothetical protein
MGNSLIKASDKLVRGITSKFIGDPYISEAAVLVPSQFRNSPGSPDWFFGPNGIDYKFIFEGPMSATKAYHSCPPLAAIVNRKAQAYINGRTILKNTKGKEVTTGDQVNRILKLIRKPNPLQSWKQFEAQQYIYIQLYGFCITLPIYPAGFEGMGAAEASSLWNIPPYLISAKEVTNRAWFKSKTAADMVEQLQLSYKDLRLDLDVNSLFIFRDFTPNAESMFFPSSRIRALAMPINNIISAYESRNELINYAGSQGILTPETDQAGAIPLKEGEKDQIQADFRRQYGIKRGQSRYIISPAALKWQQMGRPTKDLMLFEEISDDIMRICDGYGYPSPLLNSDKGPSVSNTKEYKAQVYQDAIIPESMDIYEQWNSFFQLEEKPITLSKDYDHIPVLKSDQKDDAQARYYRSQSLEVDYRNDVITLNQWRVTMGYDPTPDGDVYYSQSQAAEQERQRLVTQSAAQNNNNANEDDGSEEG